jgi:radical SAM superfamily enzyme YgiQ (UPF0313 family)
VQSREVFIEPSFLRGPAEDEECGEADSDALRRFVDARISQLATTLGHDRPEDIPWRSRKFPVLAALAPVMTSSEGEITYPGDPMCLYAALSVVIDSSVKSARQGVTPESPFPTLCPDWLQPPSATDRAGAEHGDRNWGAKDGLIDSSVYDPRVWNDEARRQFRVILRRARPSVMLISAVSPAHRYAIDMADIVKQELPDCLVVLGGRHADETIEYDTATRSLLLAHSSTLTAIDDHRIPPVVDFLVSGEGYFSLDLLMKAIALSLDLECARASVAKVVQVLKLLGTTEAEIPGSSLICAIDGKALFAFPIRGPQFDLGTLPSAYQGFAIRARFPVFPDQEGEAARTAHFMTSNACPYRCNFCSESAVLHGGIRRYALQPEVAALRRVCEYVNYGAEALFFDDSIFWSGSFPRMRSFTQGLIAIRDVEHPSEMPEVYQEWITNSVSLERLKALQYGCQLTVDLLTSLHREAAVREMLAQLRSSGCTYIYLGIESMASQVMSNVHKNIREVPELPWRAKVRQALQRIQDAGIPVGSSILFGLDGETPETIDETIEEVGLLIDDGLLMLASPNILTYHPATPITRSHGMSDKLDYHTPRVANRPPYTFFEEAFPGVVSKLLTEEDIWRIHHATTKRWGAVRNGIDV